MGWYGLENNDWCKANVKVAKRKIGEDKMRVFLLRQAFNVDMLDKEEFFLLLHAEDINNWLKFQC